MWYATAAVFFSCYTRKQVLMFQKELDDSTGGGAVPVPRPTIVYHDKEALVGIPGGTPSGTVANVQKLGIQPESHTNNITANTKLPQLKWVTTLVTTSTAALTSSNNESVLQVQKDPSGSIFTSSEAAGIIPVKLTNRTRKIVYLHLGKTGGTTLDKVLRSNCRWWGKRKYDECVRNGPLLNNAEESMISNLTGYTVHNEIMPKLIRKYVTMNNVTSFLFSLRNPVARAVSAFDMRHIVNGKYKYILPSQKYFYDDCFPTMQDLADVLSRKKKVEFMNEKNETIDCFEYGNMSMAGVGSFLVNDHLTANLQKYTRVSTHVWPLFEIFVIRTEKLWHDTENLNHALGGKEREFHHWHNYSFTHGSEGYVSKSSLTKDGKVAICCSLSEENRIYEDLMRRSVNLREDEKIGSLVKLYNDCGIHFYPTTAWTNQSFPWIKWKENDCIYDHNADELAADNNTTHARRLRGY